MYQPDLSCLAKSLTLPRLSPSYSPDTGQHLFPLPHQSLNVPPATSTALPMSISISLSALILPSQYYIATSLAQMLQFHLFSYLLSHEIELDIIGSFMGNHPSVFGLLYLLHFASFKMLVPNREKPRAVQVRNHIQPCQQVSSKTATLLLVTKRKHKQAFSKSNLSFYGFPIPLQCAKKLIGQFHLLI